MPFVRGIFVGRITAALGLIAAVGLVVGVGPAAAQRPVPVAPDSGAPTNEPTPRPVPVAPDAGPPTNEPTPYP
ncbi:MAG: hypothetical protein M3680_36940, partial [Myxococcota bacterium]|nr:hypothetical protein [Myxococcota bacterium]